VLGQREFVHRNSGFRLVVARHQLDQSLETANRAMPENTLLMSKTILIVDDEPAITEPLRYSLTREGYRVLVAQDGEKGLRLAREEKPDVVVLDLMLPKLSGWDVCRILRAESGVPIIMLTARGEEMDRVLGLELGADDYLVKPFSGRELQARIHAVLRRRELDALEKNPPSPLMQAGSLVLNEEQREVLRNGQPLSLRLKEYELLRVLMQRAGQVVTRHELLDLVWGEDWIGDTRTLDVHIRRLREKIEDDPDNPRYLLTVRGVGFRFVAPKGEDVR